MYAKTYQNWMRFGKVITKIIWCSFFAPRGTFSLFIALVRGETLNTAPLEFGVKKQETSLYHGLHKHFDTSNHLRMTTSETANRRTFG